MSDMSFHPIVLHADLLAAEDDERAPQTQFVAERQVAFLEALAVTGSVRVPRRGGRGVLTPPAAPSPLPRASSPAAAAC